MEGAWSDLPEVAFEVDFFQLQACKRLKLPVKELYDIHHGIKLPLCKFYTTISDKW
jgi:hypothetical protein